jgi:hypothetical protein
MDRVNASSLKAARANIKRWFFEGPGGLVFVPRHGRLIPVTPDEKQAICAAAEVKLANSHARWQRRTALQIVGLVVATIVLFAAPAYVHPDFAQVPQTLAHGLYTFHGLIVLREAWDWERSIYVLQDAVAFALRDKSTVAIGADGLALAEPDYIFFGNTAFGVLGTFVFVEGLAGFPLTHGSLALLSSDHPLVQISLTVAAGAVLLFVIPRIVARVRSALPAENRF